MFPTTLAFRESLSNELELLIQCSRPVPEEGTRHSIQELLCRAVDWGELTRLAFRHGLSPLVYTRLNTFLPRPLPEFAKRLKEDAFALTQTVLVHTAELKRLVPRLVANGIETLVLKGPTLAQSLYGRPAYRAFGDIDVMVQARDVVKAWALLEEDGYALSYKVTAAQLPELMRSGNHLVMYRAPNNECVELHWGFFARSRATAFDEKGAWSRRVPMLMGETTMMTLAPRDLAHFLCLHGSKHVWCRLAWLCDLVWFMHRYPTFDWVGLLEDARQMGTLRMVLVGAALARELYGVTLAPGVSDAIERDIEVMPLAKEMWRRALDGRQDLPTGRELAQFVMRTRERRGDRARDMYHHLMALRPNNLEDASPFVKRLHAYSLARLWYLVRKYGRHDS